MQPNASGTQGYNRYSYVANNPTTWVDPTGHSPALAIPVLLPAWLAISLAIAAFFIADCALNSPTGVCFGLAVFVITVFVIMACVLGGFGGACWGTLPHVHWSEREITIPRTVSQADPAPNPSPMVKVPTVYLVEKEFEGKVIHVRPLSDGEVRRRGLHREKESRGMRPTDQIYEDDDGNLWYGSRNSKNIEPF